MSNSSPSTLPGPNGSASFIIQNNVLTFQVESESKKVGGSCNVKLPRFDRFDADGWLRILDKSPDSLKGQATCSVEHKYWKDGGAEFSVWKSFLVEEPPLWMRKTHRRNQQAFIVKITGLNGKEQATFDAIYQTGPAFKSDVGLALWDSSAPQK